MTIDWQHVAEVLCTSTLPIGGMLLKGWHSAKKDREKLHEENQETLRSIKGDLEECPPHYHPEKNGEPLMARNIRTLKKYQSWPVR